MKIQSAFNLIKMLKFTPGEIQRGTRRKFKLGLVGSPTMASVFREAIATGMQTYRDKRDLESKVDEFVEILPMPTEEDIKSCHNLDAVIFLLSVEDVTRENLDIYRKIYKLGPPSHLFIEEPEKVVDKEKIYQMLDEMYISGSEWIRTLSPKTLEKKADVILKINQDIDLALAYRFPVFRKTMAKNLTHNTGVQNMIVALASSLPTNLPIIGIIISLLAVAGETTVLTLNQLKLCLQIAGIYGLETNLFDRIKELWPLVGTAFGFRTIARTLVGMVPLAGPSIKGMIAYGGTHIIGETVRWYYESGRMLSPEEKKELIAEARSKGISTVRNYLEKFKKGLGQVRETGTWKMEKLEKDLSALEKNIRQLESKKTLRPETEVKDIEQAQQDLEEMEKELRALEQEVEKLETEESPEEDQKKDEKEKEMKEEKEDKTDKEDKKEKKSKKSKSKKKKDEEESGKSKKSKSSGKSSKKKDEE